MSAIWLKLAAILCFSWTALRITESSNVLWRDVGEAVTIQCRCSETDQEYLYVKKGLREEVPVLYKVANQDKITIAKEFTDRLQVNGAFPNIDILIKNLSSKDTGPYWCLYSKSDQTYVVMKGTGSVLLVMKGEEVAPAWCNTSKQHLILLSVVISASVLLCMITGILIQLIKTQTANTRVKRSRAPTSDVYEVMYLRDQPSSNQPT